MTPKPRTREVLARGLRRRCPQCGQGKLFRRWITVADRCSECGLRYQLNHGDTWFFIVILDRIPVMLGVVAVYFGFTSTNWMIGAAFLVLMVTPLIATMPHRQGLALAIDYLSRVYMPDPSDEIRGAKA